MRFMCIYRPSIDAGDAPGNALVMHLVSH